MSKYKELLNEYNINERDFERKALLYILVNNRDLYSKIDFIYNFKEKSINPECLENGEVDFCSSSRNLIKLGFNLYNGYKSEYDDVLNIFSNLDHQNFGIALQAINIRFNR